jgi:hypothetical protein
MLQIAQTVAIVVAALVAAYTLGSTEIERRRSRLDNILSAVANLTDVYAQHRGLDDQDRLIGAAKLRLKGALAFAERERLNQAAHLTGDIDLDRIPPQAAGAVAEIQEKSDSLDELSWWGVWRRHELKTGPR